MNIVWLTPSGFSGGLLALAKSYCRKGGIDPETINFVNITKGCLYKRTKTIWDTRPERRQTVLNNLELKNPDFIIINDKAALKYITGKYLSLATCRGGIYYWINAKGKKIPCLVVDAARKIKTLKHGAWVHLQDMKKLSRWINGKQRQNPRFNYAVCKSVAGVRELVSRAEEDAIAIAIDIETTGTTIACIGYSCWFHSGEIKTWVVPFYNPTRTDGCHWETEDTEAEVWKLIRQLHNCKAYKGMQNGQYDNAYFIAYRCPVRNYIGDSLHMSHAIWREAPKRLDFISSVMMDYYRYWKDEGKEDGEDTKGYAVPKTKEGLENYWLYNALDCHNTIIDIQMLLNYITQLDWAMVNYVNEFTSQFGFCLATSMRGIKVNERIQLNMGMDLAETSDNALNFLRTMVDDNEFNPNSPQQVKTIIYDILDANEMPRKGRSSDEKVLKFIKTQSFLLDTFIEKLWECKKAKNNATKYGFMKLLNGRFMYELAAAGTYPGRFASKSHQFWVGQNIQNMPKSMRCMLEADPGYFLFDIDYSQSDAYFTAHESEDEKYIQVMLDDRDTHCVHAEHFFKEPYDKLLTAHKNHEDWVDHPIKGVRQNTKRITYGANYLMAAYTLYVTMGRDAAIGAALALGYEDAPNWTEKQFVLLCQTFLDAYFEFYPGILEWLFGKKDRNGKQISESEIDRTIARGNRATAAFGNSMIFFGDLKNDKKRQRDFAAFWGQGGTAGNINTALRKLYSMEQQTSYFMSLFQVHDSYIGQIKRTHLHKLPDLMRAMENEVEIKGRKFVVPTEASVGIGWGKRQMDWHSGITSHDIEKFDRKWLKENGY